MGSTMGCSPGNERDVCGCDHENATTSQAASCIPEGTDSDSMEDLTPIAVAAGVVAPPTAPVSAKNDSLVIVFRLLDGSEKSISFGHRKPPLGIDFSTTVPVSVKSVKPNSHAVDVGIQPGWVVLSINGENVHGWEPNAVFAKLSRAVQTRSASAPSDKTFPSTWSSIWIFRADFSCAQPISARHVNFSNRAPPFGMDFEMPAMRVKRVVPGGHAEELGVQPGWVVTSINGQDVEPVAGKFSPRAVGSASVQTVKDGGKVSPRAVATTNGQNVGVVVNTLPAKAIDSGAATTLDTSVECRDQRRHETPVFGTHSPPTFGSS